MMWRIAAVGLIVTLGVADVQAQEGEGKKAEASTNLVKNGDFEAPLPKGSTVAPHWRFVVNKKPKTPGRGTIRVTTLPDAPVGPHVAELDKTDKPGYWPALLFDYIKIEPGASYELTAFVKAEKPFHAGVSFAGPKPVKGKKRLYAKGERKYPASPKFRKITVRYPGDKRMVEAAVIFRYQGQQGKMWVDGVSLRRVSDDKAK